MRVSVTFLGCFQPFFKDSEDGVMRLTAFGTCGVGCEGLEFQALGYTAGH